MFKKWYCCFFLFFLLSLLNSISLNADEKKLDAGIDFESNETLYVSLGSFCGPASMIQTSGLRKASFPLDWALSVNGEKIIKLLEEDFAHFLEPIYLEPFVTGILLNKYYNIEFSHEGNFKEGDYVQKLFDFYHKYFRRIQRFRKLNEYKGKVFFVRSSWPLSTHQNFAFKDPGNIEISDDYAIRLYAALRNYFPNLNLNLMVINTHPVTKVVTIKIVDNFSLYIHPGTFSDIVAANK